MSRNVAKQMQEFAAMWGGFRASRVVLTANNLEIFEHTRTAKTAAETAKAAKTDLRATEILLDALAALGLLRKTGAKYRNTEIAKLFLLKESHFYHGDMLRHADALWKSWSGLDQVVRTGLPHRSGSRDHESFIKAMHNNAVHRAPAVINALDLRKVKKALDLGGGPGTYSAELAKRGVSVTLFDLPETIIIARDMMGPSGSRNIEFVGGDYHTDEFGSGYDLVFISHILHSLSQNDIITLLRKAGKALNPGGKVAIQEFLLEANRAAPVAGALFSVNMLVNTEAGRSYSVQEMKAWLLQTGFKKIRKNIERDTVVLTGTKG